MPRSQADPAPSPLSEGSEILATGTDVPGFGRIGTGGLSLLGVDDRDRLLIGGEISDGRIGLFWADGRNVTEIWTSADPVARELFAHDWTASTNGAGDVVVAGASLYVVGSGPPRRIAAIGDPDGYGNVFCEFQTPRINAAGEVAFLAPYGSPAQRDPCICTDDDCPHAVYVSAGGRLTRVATGGPAEARTLQLIGLTSEGEAIILNGQQVRSIQAVKDGSVRVLVTDLDIDPVLSTAILGTPSPAANAAGEVVFAVYHDADDEVYRIGDGGLVKIADWTDLVPSDGNYVAMQGDLFLNDSGEVSLTASWVSNSERRLERRQVVLISPTRGTRVVATDADGGYLTNDGAVATLSLRGDSARTARLTRGGSEDAILSTGDPAPGGGVFASQGLSPLSCLGPDGNVGVRAFSTDGEVGLVCGDDAGFHLAARKDDPAPGGGYFVDFHGCEFSHDAELMFSADAQVGAGVVEEAVYRARPDGIERILGPGDQATDGSIVRSLRWRVSETRQFVSFETNARGSVLADCDTDDGRALFLRHADGRFDRVDYTDTYPGGSRIEAIDFGLTDNDEVVLNAHAQRGPGALMLLDTDGHVRVVTQADGSVLAGGPFQRFSFLLVRRGGAVFRGESGPSSGLFRYLVDEKVPRPVSLPAASALGQIVDEDCRLHGRCGVSLPESLSLGRIEQAFPLDLTRDGKILLDTSVVDASGARIDSATWLLDYDGLHFVSSSYPAPGPTRANDRGNILLTSQYDPLGAARDHLLLTGPTPRIPCPVPPTAIPATPPTRPPPQMVTRPPRTLATSTPKATRTPAPTLDPEQARAVLVIDSVSGQAGQRVDIPVRLASRDADVIAVLADIKLDPSARVASNDSGKPDCRLNPAINNPLGATGWQPRGCTPGRDCIAARVALFGSDLAPIPDGAVVFTCAVDIDSGAEPGRHPLGCTFVELVDRDSNDLPAACSPGAIEITPATQERASDNAAKVAGSATTDPDETVTGADGGSGGSGITSTFAGAGGCQTAAATSRSAAWLIVLPALILGLRRRRAAGSGGSWRRRA